MKKKAIAAACITAALCLAAAGARKVQASAGEGEAGDKASQTASPSSCGALKVEGTRLVDSHGEDVQLKGISTHGIGWFPDYINEECFRQLHEEWNVNVIRLAMYTAESGGYCTDGDKEYLKDLVRSGVSYATQNDMYVIIDWHILSDNDPNMHLEEAKAFFREMSAEYAGYENVLYEICNEPNGGTSWEAIKAYAGEIIPVIRENAGDAVILVGTPNWSQFVDQAAASPITEYENLMYVLHFYAATHKEELRNTMAAAIEAGLPVFVSEYGICDASGNGAIDEGQAGQWVKLMNDYGVSYIAWNLSNKNETSAILNSTCTKISGFTAEDLSQSGRWLYGMLTGEEEKESTERPTEDAVQPEVPDTKEETGQARFAGTFVSGEMEISAVLKNSWESDGRLFFQYDLTVKNVSDTECSQWEIEVPFQDTFTLSDCWNGEYTPDGSILRIRSKDYNGTIPAGGSAGDIGFIISGTSVLGEMQEK